MKTKVFAVIGFVSIALAVYFFTADDDSTMTKEHEVEDIKELVNDYSVGNIKNQSASITSHQLIVTDTDGSQLTYDLPQDDFFVSIAPYFNQTHP